MLCQNGFSGIKFFKNGCTVFVESNEPSKGQGAAAGSKKAHVLFSTYYLVRIGLACIWSLSMNLRVLKEKSTFELIETKWLLSLLLFFALFFYSWTTGQICDIMSRCFQELQWKFVAPKKKQKFQWPKTVKQTESKMNGFLLKLPMCIRGCTKSEIMII